MGLSEGEYFVLTLHREENVDSSINLANILEGIRSVSECFEKPIVFPVHPRTRKRLDQFFPKGHLKAFNGLKMIKPVGYLDFLQLLSHSALVMTDSGGIQEESCILQVPCVTLRENTERPETVQVGSNVIAGTRPVDIVGSVQKMMRISERDWPNPYGDGAASRRIADILVRECD
jgi:UDP-N-acetylglucosamine 2-epimerase (non-hydrolysing)